MVDGSIVEPQITADIRCMDEVVAIHFGDNGVGIKDEHRREYLSHSLVVTAAKAQGAASTTSITWSLMSFGAIRVRRVSGRYLS